MVVIISAVLLTENPSDLAEIHKHVRLTLMIKVKETKVFRPNQLSLTLNHFMFEWTQISTLKSGRSSEVIQLINLCKEIQRRKKKKKKKKIIRALIGVN